MNIVFLVSKLWLSCQNIWKVVRLHLVERSRIFSKSRGCKWLLLLGEEIVTWYYAWWYCVLTTHGAWDKMAAILPTAFSSAFSSMKILVFSFKFHWKFGPLPKVLVNNRRTLVQVMAEAIIWTNARLLCTNTYMHHSAYRMSWCNFIIPWSKAYVPATLLCIIFKSQLRYSLRFLHFWFCKSICHILRITFISDTCRCISNASETWQMWSRFITGHLSNMNVKFEVNGVSLIPKNGTTPLYVTKKIPQWQHVLLSSWYFFDGHIVIRLTHWSLVQLAVVSKV